MLEEGRTSFRIYTMIPTFLFFYLFFKPWTVYSYRMELNCLNLNNRWKNRAAACTCTPDFDADVMFCVTAVFWHERRILNVKHTFAHSPLSHLASGSWMWRSAPKISSTVTFFLRARLSSSPVRAFHKRINMYKLNITHRSPHIYGHKLFCGIAVFQSCQIFFLFIANTEGNILTFLSTRLLYCTFLFCLWRWWNPATTPLLQVDQFSTKSKH